MKTDQTIEIFNSTLINSSKTEKELIELLKAILQDSQGLKDKIINNKQLDEQNTPLHIAAKMAKQKLLEFLISNGANIEAKNNKGQTAEELARENKITLIRGRAANFLLSKLKLPLYADTSKAENYLKLIRIKNEASATLENLINSNLEYKAFKEAMLNILKGASSLPKNQRREILDSCKDKEGSTALHLASKHGDLELAVLLVKNGASIKVLNKNNESPDDVAQKSQRTYVGFLANLLTLGYTGYKNTKPVVNLFEQEKIKDEAIKELEKLIKNLKNYDDKSLAKNLREIFKTIANFPSEEIKNIFDIKVDSQENSLLHYAAQKQFSQTFTLLLCKCGLSSEFQNNNGQKPIDLVADNKKEAFAEKIARNSSTSTIKKLAQQLKFSNISSTITKFIPKVEKRTRI